MSVLKIVFFMIVVLIGAAKSAAKDPISDKYVGKLSVSHQNAYLACKSGDYDMCNTFAKGLIDYGNENDDLNTGDVALPYFKLACDNGVMWGCANLALTYKNGTPRMDSDFSQAKKYFDIACTGNGGEAKIIKPACKWRDQLKSK
jgi:TPR repeat protein